MVSGFQVILVIVKLVKFRPLNVHDLMAEHLIMRCLEWDITLLLSKYHFGVVFA